MAKPTKKELRKVAEEFNEVMALEPAIKVSSTVGKLLSDIKEASNEIRDDDEFSPEVEATLVALGIMESGTEEEEEGDVEPIETESEEGEEAEEETEPAKTTPKPKGGVEKSRYGHKLNTQAADLDDLFFKGISIEDAAKELGVATSRVKSHLKHLRTIEGLTVVENKGIFAVEEESI